MVLTNAGGETKLLIREDHIMDQVLKDSHGHRIGEIKDRGNRQEIYNEHGHRLGYYDGRYTYDEHGHRIGEGNLLTTLL